MKRQQMVALILLSLLSAGGYVLAAALTYRAGFPLDDAWIHQTYARNLVFTGEWAYLPGQASAGSTAPLWTVLLAGGYFLHLQPVSLWAYLLGGALLAVMSLTGANWVQRLAPQTSARWALAGGAYLALEWHLAWAAASGMETLLAALIVLLVLAGLWQAPHAWFRLGALIGLGVWVRPDLLTLLGPVLLVALVEPLASNWRERSTWQSAAGAVLRILVGAGVLILPYLAWNQALAGTWWPNTFYAKQAEYAALQTIPLAVRVMRLLSLQWVGAGILLIPAFAWGAWRAIRRWDWRWLAAALWWLGFFGIYAWRLPVDYQHGRYLMPAMPVFMLLAWSAVAELWRHYRPHWEVGSPATAQKLLLRAGGRAFLLTTALVLTGFWLMGAQAYGRDVAFIETEMVETAQWVARNVEPDALIAAHDIGALGYYGQRQILDLAGLISPEVIPIIRDEAALAELLNAQAVDYLYTFPGWYPDLINCGEPLFTGLGSFSQAWGSEPLTVYRWQLSCQPDL